MILYRDDDWLVVDKPTGLATHAGQPGELGAVEWLDLHLDLPCHVVSRLDRGTSGVLLLARTPAASARAQEIHEQGAARKIYEFWSHVDAAAGGPGDAWTRDDELDGKPASTAFERLDRAPGGQVRYRAVIARGRRHQIRRHAAASGVPILGDAEYGGAPWPRLALHCAEVAWPGVDAPLAAPEPSSFAALARGDEPAVGLAVCADRRGGWPARVTDAFRAVHRDELDGLPVSLELFGPWAQWVVYEDDRPADEIAARVEPLIGAAAALWNLRGGVIKTYRRNPHRKTLAVQERVFGEAPPPVFTVREHGLLYEISLTETQHTGLFLDQRDTRRRVARIAAGRRGANLFAFTCSFSVAAAAAGAVEVHSVDTARACLRTGMANFEHNGLTGTGCGKFAQEDARKWLERRARRQAADDPAPPLDLVICDPPVFAASKGSGKFSLTQEWPRLARAAHDLLAPGGVAVFANNHRGGEHWRYRRDLERVFASVTELAPPLDFPRLNEAPDHVRTFWCERGPA